MVIRPDLRTGLRDEDVERLLAFARPINAAASDPLKLAHYVPRVAGTPGRITECGRAFPTWSRPALPTDPRCLVCEERAPFNPAQVTSGVIPLFSAAL